MASSLTPEDVVADANKVVAVLTENSKVSLGDDLSVAAFSGLSGDITQAGAQIQGNCAANSPA